VAGGHGLGGNGGGGDGSETSSSGGEAGDINTGGGAGGSGLNDTGGNGGSGVVILRYPSDYTISIGAGLTASTSTVGANKVTTFTAGTDTISFS
jgi:hypothetical protein